MRRIAVACATLALGCSAIGQVSAGGAVGAANGNPWGGGGVSAHLGLGGRVQSGDLDWTNSVMPVGVDVMARVYGTSQYASFAYGEGYYLSTDLGKHTGIARLLGLLECNTGTVLLCGGGVRGELVFGIKLSEQSRKVPGLFVEEHRRARNLLTIGLFGEYAGYFTRNTELPVFGLEIGYAFEDDLLDISRGALLR
jgi:hypothetical protein